MYYTCSGVLVGGTHGLWHRRLSPSSASTSTTSNPRFSRVPGLDSARLCSLSPGGHTGAAVAEGAGGGAPTSAVWIFTLSDPTPQVIKRLQVRFFDAFLLGWVCGNNYVDFVLYTIGTERRCRVGAPGWRLLGRRLLRSQAQDLEELSWPGRRGRSRPKRIVVRDKLNVSEIHAPLVNIC